MGHLPSYLHIFCVRMISHVDQIKASKKRGVEIPIISDEEQRCGLVVDCAKGSGCQGRILANLGVENVAKGVLGVKGRIGGYIEVLVVLWDSNSCHPVSPCQKQQRGSSDGIHRRRHPLSLPHCCDVSGEEKKMSTSTSSLV